MHTETVMERLPGLAEFRFLLRKFLAFSETSSANCGVAAQQYQLMQVIRAMPAGQRASITYVSERMLLQHNSAVELVDRAERAGLVRRRSDSTDHRRSLVELTEQGDSLLKILVEAHLAELDAHGPGLIQALERVLESSDDGDAASGVPE